MTNKYSINNRQIENWKQDIKNSVLFYNNWFVNFAPATYRNARDKAVKDVESAFAETDCLRNINEKSLTDNPKWITILRMSTTPPLARDRLAGLADVSRNILEKMEQGSIPRRMSPADLASAAGKIITLVTSLLDKDIMPWIGKDSNPRKEDRIIAARIIADRLCGTMADPIIRNEQERRQLSRIENFLTSHGYKMIDHEEISSFENMPPGSFTFRLNVKAKIGRQNNVNIPVDAVIMRKNHSRWKYPLLIECKSAGDYANTNKRRKEEAVKVSQLRETYGKDIEFILFLCGYFDSGYLGYEAAEGIDWVWEHRTDDLLKAGI